MSVTGGKEEEEEAEERKKKKRSNVEASRRVPLESLALAFGMTQAGDGLKVGGCSSESHNQTQTRQLVLPLPLAQFPYYS